MTFFEKANEIDSNRLVNEYAGMNTQLIRENTILKIQLQQHIDRENKLLAILKENTPDIYKTLMEGDEVDGNTKS